MSLQHKKEDEMMSLYDYLGKAAGPELGKSVYAWAAATNRSHLVKSREVITRTYEGTILVYPKGLLNEYFNNQNK